MGEKYQKETDFSSCRNDRRWNGNTSRPSTKNFKVFPLLKKGGQIRKTTLVDCNKIDGRADQKKENRRCNVLLIVCCIGLLSLSLFSIRFIHSVFLSSSRLFCYNTSSSVCNLAGSHSTYFSLISSSSFSFFSLTPQQSNKLCMYRENTRGRMGKSRSIPSKHTVFLSIIKCSWRLERGEKKLGRKSEDLRHSYNSEIEM